MDQEHLDYTENEPPWRPSWPLWPIRITPAQIAVPIILALIGGALLLALVVNRGVPRL
jgi:hypothetical protein